MTAPRSTLWAVAAFALGASACAQGDGGGAHGGGAVADAAGVGSPDGGATPGGVGSADAAPPAPALDCSTSAASPAAPALPQSFVTTCAGCHSAYGAPANAQVPNLFQYQGTATAFATQVRRGGALMPGFAAAVISDADVQAAFDYFRAGVPASAGAGAGAALCTQGGSTTGRTDACTGTTVTFQPLFVAPPTQPQAISWVDAAGVLHTRGAGRVRGRHEMEEDFAIFHPQYFQDRSFVFLIDDTIPAGGKSVTFTYLPEASAAADPATNLRYWKIYGNGNVFHTNVGMKPADPTHWTWIATRNDRDGRDIRTGDLLEFEFGVFIDKAGLTTPGTRTNYYSDTFRYRVGSGGGLTPYNADPSMNDPGTDRLGPDATGYSGGATTIPYLKLHRDLSYEQMAFDIQGENVRDFLQGRRLFHTSFTSGQHLEAGNILPLAEVAAHANQAGPLFNQPSCQGCHLRDGRGQPPEAGQPMQSMVVKLFGATTDAHGAAIPDPHYGRQLQDKAIAGVAAEGSATVAWTESAGQFADGTAYTLRRPAIAFAGLVAAGAPPRFSVRIARPLIGMGLLEAISEADILAHADTGDCNQDGVSGRPNIVWDPEDGQVHVGRLGWKAAKASVRHQVAEAALLDIGLTSRVFPAHDCGATQTGCGATTGAPELRDDDLERMVSYMRLLAVPPRRDAGQPGVQRGEILFGQLGCANCHAPTQRTGGTHPFIELRDQIIHPYTDLLLHDMGPDLADASDREFVAAAGEWRTPPLWGIGLCDTVSAGSGSTEFPTQPPCQFLHDGRARSLLEAVLWHGGEARPVRDRAAGLPAGDRTALLLFLQSL